MLLACTSINRVAPRRGDGEKTLRGRVWEDGLPTRLIRGRRKRPMALRRGVRSQETKGNAAFGSDARRAERS
jgi:hypothetical protein